MEFTWKKFLSRKFLASLVGLVAITLSTMGVETGDAIADGIARIGGAVLDMCVVMGYVAAEAKVDAAGAAAAPRDGE